ncbi:cytochrome P450 [Pseudaestuariivita sp.]|uniref:cytochrome P450 n=1 Tax=Pseudaestuariivita sp. TaxID=2211669 RepID=UPI004058D23E
MYRLQQSPTDPAFVQDPYTVYADARAHGPLVWWEEYGMVAALDHATVQALLRDRRFGRAPITPRAAQPHLAAFDAVEAHSMLDLEPPVHTRLRGLVLRAFTSRRVAALAPEIDALAHQLIDALPPGRFDLIADFATTLPVTIIARLLGVPEAMGPQLLAWSNAMVAMYQARRDRLLEDAANAAAKDFAAYLRTLIETKRTAPADDLISHLIAAEENGQKLTTDEMIGTCVLLLNAGHEATVHTFGNGVKAVLESGTQAAFQAEDCDTAVEEVLRHDPPLHIFTRIAYDRAEIASHTFERGDEVALVLGAANRDPAVWQDPDCFDPERPAQPMTSFGGGIHFCLGAPLARLELKIALHALFTRLPTLRIAAPPRYANLYHFHGLEALWVDR